MRSSQLVFRTRREVPQDAEAASHQLLVRGGYIRRLASGVYSFLPLGYLLLERISAIVSEEFRNAEGNQVLLPALHPTEIWAATGRLAKMADVLFRVESKAGSFVLGPTHEEAVIEAIAPDLASYRDLPAMVYQLQTKFRDEPRARFGLMRTREFIMADGYTFDADQEGMRIAYMKVYRAYQRMFERLGLLAVPVEADAGSIGGDVNHEFMVASAIGEDHFAECANCGYRANIEAAVAGEFSVAEVPEIDGVTVYSTPGAPGVEIAIRALKEQGALVDDSAMLKCMVAVDDRGEPAILLIPGERTLKVPGGYTLAGEEIFGEGSIFCKGYVGPVGMRERGVKILADPSIRARAWWATGNNVDGEHVVGVRIDRDFSVDDYRNLIVVEEGDPCPRCSAQLHLVRAVEVGHTFQLGLTYSSVLPHASFVDPEGARQPYWMGCYGVGVTRLPAVIAEQFIGEGATAVAWPVEVAPFEVAVVAAGRSAQAADAAERLYQELLARGLRVLLEDRGLSFGNAMGDLELIGPPFVVIAGAKVAAEGVVEVRDRLLGTVEQVALGSCGDRVEELRKAAVPIRR